MSTESEIELQRLKNEEQRNKIAVSTLELETKKEAKKSARFDYYSKIVLFLVALVPCLIAVTAAITSKNSANQTVAIKKEVEETAEGLKLQRTDGIEAEGSTEIGHGKEVRFQLNTITQKDGQLYKCINTGEDWSFKPRISGYYAISLEIFMANVKRWPCWIQQDSQ